MDLLTDQEKSFVRNTYAKTVSITTKMPAIVLTNRGAAGALLKTERLTPKEKDDAAYWKEQACVIGMEEDEYFCKPDLVQLRGDDYLGDVPAFAEAGPQWFQIVPIETMTDDDISVMATILTIVAVIDNNEHEETMSSLTELIESVIQATENEAAISSLTELVESVIQSIEHKEMMTSLTELVGDIYRTMLADILTTAAFDIKCKFQH